MLPAYVEHVFGFFADRFHLSGGFIDCDNRWFVDKQYFALGVDECVCRAKVNGKVR